MRYLTGCTAGGWLAIRMYSQEPSALSVCTASTYIECICRCSRHPGRSGVGAGLPLVGREQAPPAASQDEAGGGGEWLAGWHDIHLPRETSGTNTFITSSAAARFGAQCPPMAEEESESTRQHATRGSGTCSEGRAGSDPICKSLVVHSAMYSYSYLRYMPQP